MLFETTISTQPFRIWILKDKENRRLLLLSTVAIVGQFLIFKFFYPYPNFMPPDSFSYLQAAHDHAVINIWAIGYSWFLVLFSPLTHASVCLVWLQYFLLEASLLYLLFSLRFLLSPGKWLFRLMLAGCILNPLMPHISNFVSSDALFTALSLIWFTQLLWILDRPGWRLLTVHAMVLLMAFIVRYNALYYPIISILIILLHGQLKRSIKRWSVALIVVLLSVFIGYTQYTYKRETGVAQFSAFGGWQMAANALYGYARAPLDSSDDIPVRFWFLQDLVNHHIDSLNHLPPFMRPDNDIGVYYLWDFESPLRLYMDERWEKRKDSAASFFKRWASMGSLYGAYGHYLIRQYPGLFLKAYVWPNFIKYYAPPTGFLGSYNLGRDTVESIAVSWFGWKDNHIYNLLKKKKVDISGSFSISMAIINLVFILGLGCFVTIKGLKRCNRCSKQVIGVTTLVWLLNMIFSVMAAPIELRYQLFPMVTTFCFASFFVTFLAQESKQIPTSASIATP